MEVTPSIRLRRPLGAGGMGSVWVAHHARLETDVAVKFLLADLSVSEGALARFSDEASVAAQIKSPHVVQVLDHGLAFGELPFIVMELLDGEDLAVHVKRRGPLDLATTAALIQQLGQVLAKAHVVGIVHRDVKPENVFLLSGYGELFVKLIDFGVAKWGTRTRAVTTTGTMVGTPDFMCPEQILNSKDVGPTADYWALASVAYFSLLGRAPFARETLPATILAIEKGDFALPFESHGIGSRALDAFFSRGLCRNPEGRFSSLRELIGTFCEAAEVPLTRTLRLVAGDEGGVWTRSSASPFGSESRTTRPDLPGGVPHSRATRLGLGASFAVLTAESGTSRVATRVEPARPRTLEAGTVVQDTIDTEQDTPHGLQAVRRKRARRRAILFVFVALASFAATWSVSKRTPHLSWSHELPNLPPIVAKRAPLEPALAEPPRPTDASLEAVSSAPPRRASPVLEDYAPARSASLVRVETEELPSAASGLDALDALDELNELNELEGNIPITSARADVPARRVHEGSGGGANLKDRGF